MRSQQEQFHAASRVIEGVADCLVDYASCSQFVELYDLLEFKGRLELAVFVIREANGASN